MHVSMPCRLWRVGMSERPIDSAPAMPTPTVSLQRIQGVALLTLERPQALNALSYVMIRELTAHLQACRVDPEVQAVVLRGSGAKAFCAGGDVLEVYRDAREKRATWLDFFADEYRLDYAIHTFEKPFVALLDGITMGGGMGLVQGAQWRVTTERSRLAMPETRIGFVPDVGATYFLSRLPVALGLYLAMTGAELSGPDAVCCGLADVCVPSASLEKLQARLESLVGFNDLGIALREILSSAAGGASEISAWSTSIFAPRLPMQMPWIERHFVPEYSVMEIAASLRVRLTQADVDDDERHWLQASLAALSSHSPTMLCVTREAVLRGACQGLAEAFRMELGIVKHAIEEGDFCEGVCTRLIERGRAPAWRPPTLAEVSPEHVAIFFRPPWANAAHPLAALGVSSAAAPDAD